MGEDAVFLTDEELYGKDLVPSQHTGGASAAGMSRFVVSSTGGRSRDEARFLEKHRDVIEQLSTEDVGIAVRNGVRRGVSLYMSLPVVVKWLIFLGGALALVVVVPFILVALTQTITQFASIRRLVHTSLVGFSGVGGMLLMYLALALM